MTKKDYERAAEIVQRWRVFAKSVFADAPKRDPQMRDMTDAFVELFSEDNPRFDEARFRRACVPGANVRART